MRNRNSKGFTLIELLIVVAIIGIIAAIAIPNLLNAIDRGKQKRTMADLRSIGTAVESYAVDVNFYPQSAAGDVTTLAGILQPIYIRTLPSADGWNHAFAWAPDATTVGVGYTLTSLGKDGAAGPVSASPRTTDFDADIIFINGQFAQWPEGQQTQ